VTDGAMVPLASELIGKDILGIVHSEELSGPLKKYCLPSDTRLAAKTRRLSRII
jgi:hypothetical protein